MFKYISIGLLFPYLFFMYIYIKDKFYVKKYYLVRLPLVLLFCAVWSVVPNITSVLGLGVISGIANNFVISNIFFFHGILAKVNTTGSTWGLSIIYWIFFSLFFIYARELRRQEKEMASYKKEIKVKG